MVTIIRPSSGKGSLSYSRRYQQGKYAPVAKAPAEQFRNAQGAERGNANIVYVDPNKGYNPALRGSGVNNKTRIKPTTTETITKSYDKAPINQFKNYQGAARTSKSFYNKAGQYVTYNYGSYEQQVAYDVAQKSFARSKAYDYYKGQDAKAFKQDLVDKQKAAKLYRSRAPLTDQARYSLYARLTPEQKLLGKEKGVITTSIYGSPQKNMGYTPYDINYFRQKEKQAYDSRPKSTLQQVFPFLRGRYDEPQSIKNVKMYGEQFVTAGVGGAAIGAGGLATTVLGGGAAVGTVASAPIIGGASLGAMAGLGGYYGAKQQYLTFKAGVESKRAGNSFFKGAYNRELNRKKSVISWSRQNQEVVAGVLGGATGGLVGYYSGYKYSQDFDVANSRIIKFSDTRVNRYGKAELPKSRFDVSTEVQVGDKQFKVRSYGRGREFINTGRKISVGKLKVKQDIYYYDNDGKPAYYRQGGTAIKSLVNLGKRPKYDMFSQSQLGDKVTYRLTYGRATKVLKEPGKLLYSVSNKDVTKQYVGLGRQRYQFKLKSAALSQKDFDILMAKPRGESVRPYVSAIKKYYSARRGVVEGSFGYVERTKGVRTTRIVGSGKTKDTILEYYKGQSYSVSYKPRTRVDIGRVTAKMLVSKKAAFTLSKPEVGVGYRRALIGTRRAPPLYSESIRFSAKDLAGQAFLQLSKTPKIGLLGAGAFGALSATRLKGSNAYKRTYQPYSESFKISSPSKTYSMTRARQSALTVDKILSAPSVMTTTSTKQDTYTTPRLEFFNVPSYEQPPVVPIITIVPPPAIPFFGRLPNFDLGMGRDRPSVLRSQRKKYTPSLIALDLKIRGKAPKKITGFEIRPLQGKRKKRK